MLIKLTYFKPSGKYYACDEMLMDFCSFHTIVERVAGMHDDGRLPGLMEGAGKQYFVLVETPEVGGEGPHGVPHLLAPVEVRRRREGFNS